MGSDGINPVLSSTSLTAVFVDIDYIVEGASQGDACHCSQGHLCQDWDHAERYRVDFELAHPQALVMNVEMSEQRVSPFTYQAIRLRNPDLGL